MFDATGLATKATVDQRQTEAIGDFCGDFCIMFVDLFFSPTVELDMADRKLPGGVFGE